MKEDKDDNVLLFAVLFPVIMVGLVLFMCIKLGIQ